ncbi:hypothetical protein BESB_005330 [Besnoitia besnoiti]|uniref:Transmembrane protein n=1 Tax=Besnoitia besnoiti TaxID=94643 RepID=A0A2A9MQD2_BESBE|nr:hypothetical protein BESB_005330 [Besnoitia besnoiti]PFH38192.1 hypothetical protein BESB_005330 [Besnoitia besnoiti]
MALLASPVAGRERSFVQILVTRSCLTWLLLYVTTHLTADCFITFEHGNLTLGEQLSRGRVKVRGKLAEYAAIKTLTGYPAFERFAFLPLTKDKLAVLYNWCPEQDRHGNSHAGTSPLVLSCHVRVEFFAYTGERAQQNYYVGDTLHFRHSFMYANPDKYPELKALGFWVHGPHEGDNSNKIVIAFWTARCKTPSDVRVCRGGGPCSVNLKKNGNPHRPSCLAQLYGAESITVPAGDRICSGAAAWAHSSSECYQYELAASAASAHRTASEGWQADSSGSSHGYRLGPPEGAAQHSGGYGSVFIARFRPGEEQEPEWETLVATDVYLDYGQGNTNGLSADPGGGTASEARYAVVFHTHQWEMMDGRAVLWPQCLTQLVADDGSLVGSNGLLNKKCSSCSSRPVVRVHPQTHKWASVCTNDKADAPGVFINDNLAVGSTEVLQSDAGAAHNAVARVPVDTDAQILPVGERGEWLLFWRRSTWGGAVAPDAADPLWGRVQTAKLMIGKWNVEGRAALSSVREITGGLSVLEYSEPRISPLGPPQGSFLVGYSSALRRSATFLEITEDGVVEGSTPVVVERVLGSALSNAAFSTDWIRLADESVFWLTRFTRGNDTALEEALWPKEASRAFTLQFIRVRKRQEDPTCVAKWNREAPCDSTCHRKEVVEEFAPDEATVCTLRSGATRLPSCLEDACERLEIARVYEGVGGAAEAAADDPNALRVSDGNLETFVTFNRRPSAFTVQLKDASDVWAIALVFLLKPEEWLRGLRFTCTAYNRRHATLGSREGFLGRIAPPNVMNRDDAWAVSYWSWHQIRLFGVYALECSVDAAASDVALVLAEVRFAGKPSGACPPRASSDSPTAPPSTSDPSSTSPPSTVKASGASGASATRTASPPACFQSGGKPSGAAGRAKWCNESRVELRHNQILREAAGPGVAPCPAAVEMQFCNKACRLRYDFSYTASSTYPPVTTLPARLFTMLPLSTTLPPLSWQRWFTVERMAAAAWLLAAALLLLFLGLCVCCSFRAPATSTPEPVAYAADQDLPPRLSTFTSMRRRTTVRIHSAATAVAEIVAAAQASLPPADASNVEEGTSRKSVQALAEYALGGRERPLPRAALDVKEDRRARGTRRTLAEDASPAASSSRSFADANEDSFGLVPIEKATEGSASICESAPRSPGDGDAESPARQARRLRFVKAFHGDASDGAGGQGARFRPSAFAPLPPSPRCSTPHAAREDALWEAAHAAAAFKPASEDVSVRRDAPHAKRESAAGARDCGKSWRGRSSPPGDAQRSSQGRQAALDAEI